uniref:Fibrinogen C-terminal domain-containing protein n=1 Tax=Echinostoma caproni TaxID=27848 RepID=A0A183B6Q3_9TREM
LNKYQTNEMSFNEIDPRDLNQNKATGADSELTTVSPGNTGVSVSSKDVNRRGDLSEQRGGSTMSDLHNTEYMDESRTTRSRVSPKTPSSKATEVSSAPRVQKPQVTEVHSPSRVQKPQVTEEASEDTSSVQVEPPIKMKRITPQSTHTSNPSSVKVSISSSVPQPKPLTLKKQPTSEKIRTTGEGERRIPMAPPTSRPRYSSNRSATSEEEDGDEEEDEEDDGEGETGSESFTGQPYTEPDPTALRDLDNASPKTIAMCDRHACHYCFFVYFPSASVDEDLMPFRRKAFIDKVARLQNPDHVREVMETKCARDAYTDRRIKSIERQSGTEIRLSELDPSSAFIKGLPRRRLTIAGPTFAHIGCALNLFESLLPKVVKTGIFPYRLPEGSSTRFASGARQSSHFQWTYGRKDGTVLLRNQLDDKGGWRGFLVQNKTGN